MIDTVPGCGFVTFDACRGLSERVVDSMKCTVSWVLKNYCKIRELDDLAVLAQLTWRLTAALAITHHRTNCIIPA